MTEELCAVLARDAVKDATASSNPILLTEEEYRVLFHNALHGELGV